MAACSKIMPPFHPPLFLSNNSFFSTLCYSLPTTSHNLQTRKIEIGRYFQAWPKESHKRLFTAHHTIFHRFHFHFPLSSIVESNNFYNSNNNVFFECENILNVRDSFPTLGLIPWVGGSCEPTIGRRRSMSLKLTTTAKRPQIHQKAGIPGIVWTGEKQVKMHWLHLQALAKILPENQKALSYLAKLNLSHLSISLSGE